MSHPSASAPFRDCRRWAVVVLLALANAGCGIGFLYNNLDRLVRWELDGVLAMTPDQKAFFETEFAALWRWHRTEELPRYADDLSRWAALFDGPAEQAPVLPECGASLPPKALSDPRHKRSAASSGGRDGCARTGFQERGGPRTLDGCASCPMRADIDELFLTVEGWWLRIEAKGAPVVAEFLRRLDESQVTALAEALEESNADWEKQEKGKTLDVVRKAWRKDFESILKRFTGPLTPEQRALIADAAEGYQPERELWADYRRRWQRDLFALMRHRAQAGEFATGFERLVKVQKLYYGEPFARIEAANEALVKMTLAEVLGHAPPEQRDRLRNTLNDRAEELRALASDGEATTP